MKFLWNDDSWKEISEIQVGESVKSHFVSTSLVKMNLI
jgi:hypothetical protein